MGIIIFGLVFAPWESSLLGSGSSLFGTSAAEAQQQQTSGYLDGTNATQCDTATFPAAGAVTEASDRLTCILTWDACPQSPVDAARLLTRSPEYMDMCEEYFLFEQAVSASDYDECVRFFDNNQDPDDTNTHPSAVPARLGGYDPDSNGDGTADDGICWTNLIIQAIDADGYTRCTGLTGVTAIAKEYSDNDASTDDRTCRIVAPAGCPSQVAGEAVKLNRVGGNTCEQHVRRMWDCPSQSGAVRTDKFNTCYVKPTGAGAANPACANGAPSFGGGSCEKYVGDDSTKEPACRSLSSSDKYFVKGITITTKHNSITNLIDWYPYNEYWCIYDTRWLRLDCHRSSHTTCPDDAAQALCLKRKSGIGGCDGVVAAVICRDLQAAILDGAKRATDAYAENCTPCVILPFSDALTTRHSSECPDSYHVALAVPADGVLKTALDMHDDGIVGVGDDFEADDANCKKVVAYESDTANPKTSPQYTPAELANCKQTPKCMDPPRGRLAWRSTHASQIALAGADVIVSIVDLPPTADDDAIEAAFVEFADTDMSSGWTSEYVHLDDGSGGRDPEAGDHYGPPRALVQIGQASDSQGNPLRIYRHRDGATETNADEIVRSWGVPTQTGSYDRVSAMTDGWQCALKQRPHFRLTARPLWPDLDEAEIEELFGDDSLGWWDVLGTGDKIAYSSANGFTYIDPVTTDTADRIAEQRRRQTAPLAESIECSWSDRIWCRWSPRQRGYYRLEATGAWLMHRSQLEQLDTTYVAGNMNEAIRYGLGHDLSGPKNLHVGQMCKPTTSGTWHTEGTGRSHGGQETVTWGDIAWGSTDWGARAFPDCFRASICRWLIPGHKPLASIPSAEIDDCRQHFPDPATLKEYGLEARIETDSQGSAQDIPVASVRASFGTGTHGRSGTSGEYGDLGDDAENLYRFYENDRDGTKFRCPSRDARVICSDTTTNVNLTKTAPIGVIVYEARVDSRPAS